MPARKFKTPVALGIPEEVFRALVKTLDMFEHGEVPEHKFDMSGWTLKTHCGTTHCIGGWVEHFARKRLFSYMNYNPFFTDNLYRLFYPPDSSGKSGYDATMPQATLALRNYLTLGKACWPKVMRG